MLLWASFVHIVLAKQDQASVGDNEVKRPERYLWTTAPAH